MSKRLFEIECLHLVYELAKKYRDQDPDLDLACSDVAVAIKQREERYAQSLHFNGINCAVCNRRFLPLPDNYSNCCSIGCRYK